jgi:transcriptional regulator GlxA family with amidase domain
MICVRLVAYEQLVATARLPVTTARLLAGFTDPSNMRRHSKRAARRSPPVAHALEALHLAPRRPHVATHGQEVA